MIRCRVLSKPPSKAAFFCTSGIAQAPPTSKAAIPRPGSHLAQVRAKILHNPRFPNQARISSKHPAKEHPDKALRTALEAIQTARECQRTTHTFRTL